MTLFFKVCVVVLSLHSSELCSKIPANVWQSQKASFYYIVAFNITGNRLYLLEKVKWVYTLVTVQIPHGVVLLVLSIQNFNLWFWLLLQSMLCECRQAVSPNRTHAGRDTCIFLYVWLWFLPVLYSCAVKSNQNLYIYTFYFLSKLFTK